MDIRQATPSVASSFTREANEAASSLSINLSRNELIDRKILQIQERQDRNHRRDLLRDSLSLKSSIRELQRLVTKGSKQVDSSADPLASSKSNLGLDTSGGGDLDKAIDQVAALDNISSGTIVVMGVNISIDVTSDSINDVIDRINNSNANVTASFNTTDNKFEITSENDFTLSNGTSNFFSTLDVTTGTIESEEEDTVESFFKSSKVLAAFNRFSRRLNQFFETAAEVSEKLGIANDEDEDGETLPDNPFATSIKEAIENAVTSTFDEDFDGTGKVRFDYGLTLSFTTGDFIEFDAKEFDRNLTGQISGLTSFFLTEVDDKNPKSGGLMALLDTALSTINSDLEDKINVSDKTGLLVDTEA
ncbi:MAG: hypothetical protein NE327_18970 [Lentisphaeraceae bacterium]|nr:hypothetical protein [Lentisphaeraceae bacterium]